MTEKLIILSIMAVAIVISCVITIIINPGEDK